MGLIAHRLPWTSQPQDAARVRGRYAVPGAVVYVPTLGVVVGPNELAEGGLGTSGGVGQGGIFRKADAASGYGNLGKLPRLSPGACTFVWVLERTSSDFRYICGTVDTGTAYIDQMAINCSPTETASTGNILLSLRSSSGAIRSAATTGAPIQLGRVHTVVAQVVSSTVFKIWVDGVEQSITYGNTGSPAASSGLVTFDYALFNRNVRGSLSSGDTSTEVFLFARLPTNDLDPEALSADPWQIFEPVSIPVPTTASGLPTLGTVSATAITSSAFRPSVTYTY